MQNEKHAPPLDPNPSKGESKPVRNEEPREESQRLWKHESEIPDASKKSTDNSAPGQRSDSN